MDANNNLLPIFLDESIGLSNIHQSHYLASTNLHFPRTGLKNSQRYYYCVSGIPKSLYHRKLGLTVNDYIKIYNTEIYPAIQSLIESYHIYGKQYLIYDDTKLIGIIFQPSEQCKISPMDFAKKIQNTLQKIYLRVFPCTLTPYCNTTALSDVMSGEEALYYGAASTLTLKQLSFFLMSQQIFSKEYITSLKNHADYETITLLCQRICNFASPGDFVHCQAQVDNLFLHVLKYSFNFELVSNCLSHFKNYLYIRATVYGLPDRNSIFDLCDLKNYITIEDCHHAIRHAFKILCDTVNKSTPYTNIVVLAAYYIHAHITEDVALTDMSEYANTTPAHLSRIFHQQVGKTIKQYQNWARIHRAQELLLHTSLSVNEIAQQCGFRSRCYFSDTFKKSTGVTPQQYRLENKGTSLEV